MNSPNPITTSNQSPPAFGTQPVSRFLVLSLLKTSLDKGEARFARRLALSWLTSFPGDLQISLLHAQALIQLQQKGVEKGISGYQQALPILDAICQVDPENVEALETMARCQRAAGVISPQQVLGNLVAVEGKASKKEAAPAWSRLLRQSRQALAAGQVDMAEQLIHQVLLAEPPTPLPSLTHLQVEMRRELPAQSIRSLAELYHQRWPNCVQFTLILADTLMQLGESDRAVELLHQAVGLDVSGQTADHLWGKGHQYRSLWPDPLESMLSSDLSVPPIVASAMGWNQLPANVSAPASRLDNDVQTAETTRDAQPANPDDPTQVQQEVSSEEIKSPFFELGSKGTDPEPATDPETQGRKPRYQTAVPEALRSIQDELERVAINLKQPHLASGDGRFPIYVILSSRQALETQYGKSAAETIHTAMLNLAEAVKARKDWGSLLFYADEGSTSGNCHGSTLPASLGIKPARSGDPWSIKLALADLDAMLSKNGQMIGALLIVGGTEIIPFHHLPNPVDDADTDVPSDNPYGTRDDNYFAPEWPVGRMPGGDSREAQPLLNSLHAAALRHSQAAQKKPWYTRWWEILFNRFRPGAARFHSSLGYTAAIWRQASLNVFRPIGEDRAMLVSPPTQAKTSPDNPASIGADGHFSSLVNRNTQTDVSLGPARLAYFNLHGMVDAVEWFGQCDPHDPSPGPDYPVALRPLDLALPNHNNGSTNKYNEDSSPIIVFSEACYGAHIQGRTIEQAISLKFLACGTHAVAGSTCIAYGSISAPLAAADLLGYSFWTYLSERYPAGEALRRAKINLAQEMHRRQGYLDGEDQKTLISFVLYGDPLAQALTTGKQAKSVFRTLKPPVQINTICDRSEDCVDGQSLAPEVMDYVKHVVSQYLPGMCDASLALTKEHSTCHSAAHNCPTHQMDSKIAPSQNPDRRVVTLSKQVQKGSGLHRHYARLTLDSQGKLVKLVVSR